VSDAMLALAASDVELAFDHVGLHLVARAGYDEPCGLYLLERLPKAFPWWDDDPQPSPQGPFRIGRQIRELDRPIARPIELAHSFRGGGGEAD